MIAFQEKTISDLISEEAILAVQDGNHGEKHPKSCDYVESGIHFVMANDLNSGSVDLKGCNKIPENLASKLRIGFSEEGDVLLTHKGTIGNVAIVGPIEPYVMLTPQVTYYRTNDDKLSNKYLSYAFREPMFQKRMKSLAQQSTRPYIGITAQRNLKILWTDRKTQDSVVDVLSKYDNLIENNKRRIKLLEESARQLYKEWFVRFRFPGHEHVKIIDGVPEGWERCTAPQTLYINPRVNVEKGKEILYVPMACLSESQMTVDASKFEHREKHTAVKFKLGDTLFARITPCLENGKTAYVNFLDEDEVACGSTEFIILRGNKVSNQFAYLLAREESFRGNAIKSMIGSSGRQRVQPSCFDKYIVAVAPSAIQEQFDEVVELAFKQISLLINQNNQLAKARDLLLPKLMNGEIAV